MNLYPNRCPADHPCPLIRVCPTGAISQEGFNAPTLDESKCINCGNCSTFCAYEVFQQD